jgi:tRNA(Ile)-lysidine synthase
MQDFLQDFKETIDRIFNIIFLANQKKNYPKKIAVAVSGGSDSMALTYLLYDYCREKNIDLIAITINHNLRKNSLIEAKKINKIFSKKNISHQVISIDKSDVPDRNIEANLRKIRYQLMTDFCKKNHIDHLFLAHIISDIAENFLIRLFRGSGLDGLSSISEISEIEKVKIIRPLLNFEKDQLKNYLISKKTIWFEDETNKDEKFLRNKFRNFLATFSDQKIINERIKNACDEISLTRDLFDEKLLKIAKKLAIFDGKQFFIEIAKNSKTDLKILLKILALILMEVSQKDYKPRLKELKFFYLSLFDQNIMKKEFYGCVAIRESEKIWRIKPRTEEKEIKLKTILAKIFN